MGFELDMTTLVFGLVGLVVVFGGLPFVLMKRDRAIWLIGGMLFASCLGVAVEANGRISQGFFYPLQQYRSELFLAFGIFLGLQMLVHFRASAGRRPAIQASILAFMGLYAALLRFVHEGGAAGISSVIYWGATLLPLVIAGPVLLRDFVDSFKLLRMVAVVNVIWVAMVLVQIGVEPSKVLMGRESRFIGLLGNPQHAGSLMAVFLAVAVYLLMNENSRRFKTIALGLIGIDLILLGWSGSRTGLGMAVLGVTGVLYARFGKAVLWLPVAGVFAAIAFAALKYFGATIGFERLGSTKNTREKAWTNLLENALSSPVVGMGVEGAGDSENGYLYGFAAYGFGMVLLILVLIGATAYTSLKLWARRKYLSLEYRSLSDFLIGYNALYFGGSVFEGYMMARVAANLTFFMIFSAIASQLIQMTDQAMAAEHDPELDGHDAYGYADDDYEQQWEDGGYDDAVPAT